VKRLIALAVGLFGLRAYLKRRRRTVEPADELRERLAAQRTTAAETSAAETSSAPVEEPPAPVEEPEPEPADEPPAPVEEPEPVAEAQEPGSDVDARRAEVHARARQKIDELSS
jgi:hypothetical protein